MQLNVGCGRNILPGWVNIDCAAVPGVDVTYDLDNCANEPLPFADNSVNAFLLSHVIEHIRQALPLMQELHRVAEPGAKATIRVPHGASDDAWEDPTHVSAYFPGSFGYFSQPFYWRADYGYRGDWRMDTLHIVVDRQTFAGMKADAIFRDVMTKRNVVKEMIAELQAVKPVRQPLKELQSQPHIEFVLG
jgi:ubiquinone/menaquinone biosynthesis C-methylase UbiE